MSEAKTVQPAWQGKGFRLGLFASGHKTGDYMSRCHKCGEAFIGDKLAKVCLPCAALNTERALAAKDAEIERLTRERDEAEHDADEKGHWYRVVAAENEQFYEALKGLVPILEAVRYTAGLGKNQMARVEKAKALIATETPQRADLTAQEPRSGVPGSQPPASPSGDPD